MKGDRMKSAMFELYKALKQIVASGDDFEHGISDVNYDWMIKGEVINKALDVLKKYKKQFDEENRTKDFERIDITPVECGNHTHYKSMGGPEDRMLEYENKIYFWFGGCPMCIDEKIKEIKSK